MASPTGPRVSLVGLRMERRNACVISQIIIPRGPSKTTENGARVRITERRASPMGGIAKILACTGLITLSASLALGAAIKGSVKGPDEAPYMGAFVMARNSTTK